MPGYSHASSPIRCLCPDAGGRHGLVSSAVTQSGTEKPGRGRGRHPERKNASGKQPREKIQSSSKELGSLRELKAGNWPLVPAPGGVLDPDLDLSLSPHESGKGKAALTPLCHRAGTENTSSHCPESGVEIHSGSGDVKQDRRKARRDGPEQARLRFCQARGAGEAPRRGSELSV